MKKNGIDHKMCVSISCTISLSETFLILRRTGRDMIESIYWFSYYACQVVMKLEIFGHISKKKKKRGQI